MTESKIPLLVTFGCSWTYGKGLGCQPWTTKDEYWRISDDSELANMFSYRVLLSEKFNMKNINFAESRSSNQRQFRLAKKFFASEEFKLLQQQHSTVIVLWAITSTVRNEMFSIADNALINFKYDERIDLAKMMLTLVHNHQNEVDQLATEMRFWNDYFAHKGIHNTWVDTFNHHQYPFTVSNLFGGNDYPRDLLSKLVLKNGIVKSDSRYHKSESGNRDTDRLLPLVKAGVLNHISCHPTKLGHAQIAEMLSDSIATILDNPTLPSTVNFA